MTADGIPDIYDGAAEHHTAADVYALLRLRGETVEQHLHLWVRWDAWEDWGWNPRKGTKLFVCNVPECLAMTAVPL